MVSLKPMTRQMCHAFYQNFQNDPAIGHYYEYVYTEEIADRYFDNNSVADRKLFAILVGDQIVGECKLKNIDPKKRECSMGIHLQNDAVKGKGYGTQAERLVLQYAFEELGMVAVNADAALKNTRSQHVLEKVGFRYTHEDDTFKYYRCEKYDRGAEMITKTESFLKDTFAASSYLQANPTERDYRLEHSYRVANIAKQIAEAEGFNVTYAVIAGLLHDIAYCEEMVTREDRLNHGRRSAAIARPFLENLGLPADAVNEICYGIAIHVDDEADFEWNRTPFCETVGDADNIDRFDVYRIYETLEYIKFSEMNLEDKQEKVASTIDRLTKYKEMKLGTATAKNLWIQRLDYYIGFYEKLKAQLDNSTAIL